MRLTTLYVLFIIELGTRRVRMVGVTDHPSGSWVVQRARELSMDRMRDAIVPRFLIRDRDRKFTRAFDDVFAADGIQIIKTPIQAPNANAFAERWVRTVREECLDWTLVWGRRHLERVLGEYVRTTTTNGRTEVFTFARRAGSTSNPCQHHLLLRSLIVFGGEIASGAWFTSTTRSRHDVRVSEPNGRAVRTKTTP